MYEFIGAFNDFERQQFSKYLFFSPGKRGILLTFSFNFNRLVFSLLCRYVFLHEYPFYDFTETNTDCEAGYAMLKCALKYSKMVTTLRFFFFFVFYSLRYIWCFSRCIVADQRDREQLRGHTRKLDENPRHRVTPRHHRSYSV